MLGITGHTDGASSDGSLDRGLDEAKTCGGLFNLGHCGIVQSALDACHKLNVSPFPLIARHHRGDWGDIHPEDAKNKLNELAVENGGRIFSVYKVTPDLTLWIITEADRSLTTVMLPEDY